MIRDLEDYFITGNAVPIRSDKSFYQLGKKHIIRDPKARRIVQKQTGKRYFGSFKEFTAFTSREMSKILK